MIIILLILVIPFVLIFYTAYLMLKATAIVIVALTRWALSKSNAPLIGTLDYQSGKVKW